MLLIGAIVLAVLFVSLAVVLNGSIHTTTTAAEASNDMNERQTVALHNVVNRDVASLMKAARTEHPDDFGNQESYVRTNVTSLGASRSSYYAHDDRHVTFNSPTITEGRLVEHSSGQFEPTAAAHTFSFSTSLRKFNIQPTNWGSINNPFIIRIVPGPNPIVIEIDDSGDTIEVSGGSSGTCNTGVSNPSIEITNATLAGEPCPALEFFEDLDSYTVQFENGNEIEGSYSFIGEGTSITGEEVVYSVQVPIEERSPQINYERTIKVAPGEPR